MSKAINNISAVLERLLPVGSIVEWAPVDGDSTDLSTPEKVAAYYGFGTWEAYGSGRMLLGVSGSHAIGSTGGEEMHTLTQAELPKIVGRFKRPPIRYSEEDEAIRSVFYGKSNLGPNVDQDVENPSGGKAHQNMPPYITVYRWRRIA